MDRTDDRTVRPRDRPDNPMDDSTDERITLEELFERYERLPSRDAEETKRELVDRMLEAVADGLAQADADEDGYRTLRDVSARVRLLAPGAEGFDDAVLQLIDAAREAFGAERLGGLIAERAPQRDVQTGAPGDAVTEASEDSFPASDPPGYVAGGESVR
jgi:hypothetical protein